MIGPPQEPDLEEGEERLPGYPKPQSQERTPASTEQSKPATSFSPGSSMTGIPALKGDRRTIINSQGAIANLMLPARFVQTKTFATEFTKCIEYQVPDNATMKIAHWFWDNSNARMSIEVAAAFSSVLDEAPHTLTDDEMMELEQLIPQEVYGHTDAYDLISMRTEDFGGRNVLVFENKWWDADLKAFGMFFPSDVTYQTRESLHFEGTDKDYRATFLSAKVSFMRIKWNELAVPLQLDPDLNFDLAEHSDPDSDGAELFQPSADQSGADDVNLPDEPDSSDAGFNPYDLGPPSEPDLDDPGEVV